MSKEKRRKDRSVHPVYECSRSHMFLHVSKRSDYALFVPEMSCCSLAAGSCRNVCSKVSFSLVSTVHSQPEKHVVTLQFEKIELSNESYESACSPTKILANNTHKTFKNIWRSLYDSFANTACNKLSIFLKKKKYHIYVKFNHLLWFSYFIIKNQNQSA